MHRELYSLYKNSIIVSHPAQQHSYRLAAALEKAGLLHSYCTTVYYNPNKLLYRFLSFILRGNNITRMKNRKSDIFEYRLKNIHELLGLLYLYIVRKDKKGRLMTIYGIFLGHMFGKATAKYAMKNNARVVVAYDNFSYSCFKYLDDAKIIRILDVSSIPIKSIVDIIRMDMENASYFKILYTDYINSISEKNIQRSIDELYLSDYFLVPSEFVKNELLKLNVKKDKILLARYGVDISRFCLKNIMQKKENDKVVFLFVGRISPQKGVHYLFEAFKQLNRSDIELRIAGNMMNTDEALEHYKDYFVNLGSRPNNEMPEIYQSADVFILPSMYEGAALVILEALASGLPVIASENCGSSELLTESINGFTFPAGDIELLKEKIMWFCNNKEKIADMSNSARALAEKHSWLQYEDSINEAFKIIFEKESNKKGKGVLL